MKIAIKDKTHLGGGVYDVLAQFKYTKAVDGLGDKVTAADGTTSNVPHVHVCTYRIGAPPTNPIDLAVNNTKPKRKAAILVELTKIAEQYRTQTLAARAKDDAAADNAADLNVDTDDGSDVTLVALP